MRALTFTPFLVILLLGCQSEKKSQYIKCMDSGTIELYGDKLAPSFCKCFSDGIASDESPFFVGNRCAKPILEKMLDEV